MAVQPDKVDGYQGFQGGMNEGLAESRIQQFQTKRNINVSLRNLAVQPRPKLRELTFTFLQTDLATKKVTPGALTYEQNLYAGRLQHVGKYQTSDAEYLVLVVNGVIYLLDVNRCVVQVLEGLKSPKLLNYNCVRINGTQAYTFYVLFDWPHQPVVVNNKLEIFRTSTLGEAIPEIPKSYIGAFVHNRLHVGNNGIEWGSSDPAGPANPDAPITFQESIVTDLNPNPAHPDQFFSLSYIERLSNITAMGYLQQTDGTSPLGFGPLFVSTKEAVYLYPVNQPRDNWDAGRFGSVYIFNYGIVGQKAHVNVGPDLFYKSFDGNIYSSGTLFSDQRRWGNTHLSNEISESLVPLYNRRLLKYSSLGYFDNRLYTTLRPYIVKAKSLFNLPIEDYVAEGVGVLEINNISGISGNSAPVWAGVNSGTYSDMLELDNRFFYIMKLGESDRLRNAVFEQDDSSFVDSIAGLTRPVRSRIYTRELTFDTPFQTKNLRHVHLDVRNIVGKFKAYVYHRESGTSEWQSFGNIFVDESCCGEREALQNEFIYKDSESEACARSFQFRIDLEGEHYELVAFNVFADLNTELDPQRDHDAEDPDVCATVEFKNAGDFDLWQ